MQVPHQKLDRLLFTKRRDWSNDKSTSMNVGPDPCDKKSDKILQTHKKKTMYDTSTPMQKRAVSVALDLGTRRSPEVLV